MCAGQSTAVDAAQQIDICHVSASLERGGLEMLLVDMAQISDRDRFRHRFIALHSAGMPAEILKSMGCDVTVLELATASRYQRATALRSALAARLPHLVHSHNRLAGVHAGAAAMSLGIRARINTEHGAGVPSTRRQHVHDVTNACLNSVIVGVSSATTANLTRRWTSPWTRHECIPNGIDLHRFSSVHHERDPTTLISVGRLAPGKGQDMIIQALAIARRDRPELHLDVVGDGPCRNELESLAHRLGVADAVDFLGDRSNVPALLARAGAFVQISTSEGLPIAVLEAMAAARPCIAADVGGVGEVVADTLTGRLVDQDPTSAAAAMVEFAREPQAWREMGQAGRTRVERDFTIGRMVGRYSELYEELIEQDRARTARRWWR
jgi:glycosyltransferase involved in cell wall biosynthesis